MSEIVILGAGGAFASVTRHNPSVAVLHGSATHVFDCGEPVAALLYRNGISVTSVRNIFISHLHMDHVGGLPQLLHAIRLLSRQFDPAQGLPWAMHVNSEWHVQYLRFPLATDGVTVDTTVPSELRLHLPQPGIAPLQQFLAAYHLGPERLRFRLDWRPIRLGEVYAADGLTVTAAPSTHVLRESFCFLVELNGLKIVYSGDLGSLDDLLPIIGGTDVLLLETSHTKPDDVVSFLRRTRPERTVLVHVHPGREDGAAALARELDGLHVTAAHDGMRIPL